MPKFNHRGIVIGLVAVIALLLSITVGLAKDNQKQEFAMLDDFAAENGASGSGESSVSKGSVKIKVKAEGLLPRHQYEMKVIITTGRPPIVGLPPDAVVTCGPETSNRRGKARFKCDIDLVQLATEQDFLLMPGDEYRLDFFVTHIHPTDPAGNPQGGDPDPGVILPLVLDRDPLLRCSPASRHSF